MLYIVHVTAFCLGGPFFSRHGVVFCQGGSGFVSAGWFVSQQVLMLFLEGLVLAHATFNFIVGLMVDEPRICFHFFTVAKCPLCLQLDCGNSAIAGCALPVLKATAGNCNMEYLLT